MSQHLPLRIARPLRRKCLFAPPASATVRPFSTTMTHQRSSTRSKSLTADMTYARAEAKKQTKQQKAPATMRMEVSEDGRSLSEDLGVLPGTFIRTWAATPSLLPQPLSPLNMARIKEALGRRWTYERKYIVTKARDLWSMLYYKWWIRKGPLKNKPKVWKYKEVRRIANERYVELMQAFAEGKTKGLDTFALPSLVDHFQERIASRPDEIKKMKWTLLRRQSRPRVVSNRMTIYPIPGAEDRNGPTALRQVVLRLKTRQRLTIERKPEDRKSTPKGPGRRLAWTPDGVQPEVKKGVQVPEVETHENDVVEYILMQQRMLKGQEEEWKVWGFVNRTTLESIAEDEKFIEQNELWQQQQRQAQGAVAAA